jgi:ATP-dependent DNA ligase
MNSPLDRLPDEQRRLLRRAPGPPEPGTPMLAVLSSRRAFDTGWLFERKLDGVRALIARDARGARIFSRNGRSQDATYPELVDALAAQQCEDFVADGEIVAMRGGNSDFAVLQQRLGPTGRHGALQPAL